MFYIFPIVLVETFKNMVNLSYENVILSTKVRTFYKDIRKTLLRGVIARIPPWLGLIACIHFATPQLVVGIKSSAKGNIMVTLYTQLSLHYYL